jgi:Nuclease-related domain
VGVAGAGADEQARRAARRVDRLRRETPTATERIAAAERRERAWAVGAEGERLVAETLAELERHGWTVLHDVRWPGRRFANLDHVAVGPGGVVVVDAKNWSGPVSVRDGVLRAGAYRKDDELEGVAAAVAAVAALLEPRVRSAVAGLLCLVAHEQPPAPTGAGVTVLGRDHLVGELRALPPRLSASQVRRTADLLRAELDDRTPASATPVRASAVPPAAVSPAARPPLTWLQSLLLVVAVLVLVGLTAFAVTTFAVHGVEQLVGHLSHRPVPVPPG